MKLKKYACGVDMDFTSARLQPDMDGDMSWILNWIFFCHSLLFFPDTQGRKYVYLSLADLFQIKEPKQRKSK